MLDGITDLFAFSSGQIVPIQDLSEKPKGDLRLDEEQFKPVVIMFQFVNDAFPQRFAFHRHRFTRWCDRRHGLVE